MLVISLASLQLYAQNSTLDKAVSYLKENNVYQLDSAALALNIISEHKPVKNSELWKLYHFYYARFLIKTGSTSEGIKYFEEAHQVNITTSVTDFLFPCINGLELADRLSQVNRSDEALQVLKEAIEFCEVYNDKKELATAYFIAHVIYYERSDFAPSLYYIEKAFEIDKVLGDSSLISSDLNSMAKLNFHMYDYEASLDLNKKSINYLGKNAKPLKLKNRYGNLAINYLVLEQLDSALIYVDKALYYARKLQQPNEMLLVINQKLQVLIKLELYKKAKKLGNKSRSLTKQVENQSALAEFYLHMGTIYSQFHKDSSRHYIQLADKIGHQQQSKLIKNEIAWEKARGLYEQGAYKKAAEYFKNIIDWNKEQLKVENRKIAKNLKAQFDLYKKDQEIEVIQLENSIKTGELKRRKIISWSLTGLIGLLLMLFMVLYHFLQQRRKIAELELQTMIQEKEVEITDLHNRVRELLEVTPKSMVLPSLDHLNEVLENMLTKKEYKILGEIVKGMSNKEIAAHQFISINTVKYHLKNIYNKLDVNNRKAVIHKISDIPMRSSE